ncbi:MAG: DNA topoisomerase [Enterocloster sp.]
MDTKNISVYPKQVINNSKVSDHHAIIPTVNVADTEFGKLPSGEQKVLSLITARLLSALGEPAVRSEVDVEFSPCRHRVQDKDKEPYQKGMERNSGLDHGKQHGFRKNDKEEKSGNANMLACIAMLTNGKSYPLQNPKMEEGKAHKKHFTEDSLLSAMERAGADEMPDEAERKGIGTSAKEQQPLRSWCELVLWKEKGIEKRNIFCRLIKECTYDWSRRNRSSLPPRQQNWKIPLGRGKHLPDAEFGEIYCSERWFK